MASSLSVHVGSTQPAYDYATFSYGAFKMYDPDPSAGTVGIPIGSPALTPSTGGDLIISSGATFDLVDFQRLPKIRTSAPVRFTRCKFSGNSTLAAVSALVDCRGTSSTVGPASQSVTFYDCEFEPATPSVWWNGSVIGHNWAMFRCKTARTVDGAGVYNNYRTDANVAMYGCYSDRSSYFARDDLNHSSAAPNGTHNDTGVQWQGGSGLTIVGCNFQGFFDPTIGEASYTAGSPNASGGGPNNTGGGSGWNPNYPNMWTNSVMQVTNATSECSGLLWDGNLSDGGGYQINIGPNTGSYSNLGVIQNSRFGRNSQWQASGAIIAPKQSGAGTICVVTITGCTYSTDGTAIAVNRI